MEQVYFPILKAKDGELSAIKELSGDVRKAVLPILQVPYPNQQRNKPPRKADKKYIEGKVKKIKNSIQGMPFILDISLLALDPQLEKLIITSLSTSDLFTSTGFYPLIDVNNPSNFYQACLVNGYTPDKICLRVTKQNIRQHDIHQYLQQIIESVGCNQSDVILLLDLGMVSAEEIDNADSLTDFCLEVKRNFDFDAIVLGSGAFPDSLAGVTPWTCTYYERKDWKLYKRVIERAKDIKYSDYAINTAAISSGPAFRGPSSIRYTIDDHFMVVKGILSDPLEGEPVYEQHRRLSDLIVSGEYYKGLNYSWGDNHIYNCTQPSVTNTGSPSTWRAVGTSHHIVHVVDALSRLL